MKERGTKILELVSHFHLKISNSNKQQYSTSNKTNKQQYFTSTKNNNIQIQTNNRLSVSKQYRYLRHKRAKELRQQIQLQFFVQTKQTTKFKSKQSQTIICLKIYRYLRNKRKKELRQAATRRHRRRTAPNN